VIGDEPPIQAHPNTVEIGGDVNEPAYRRRVDGVIARVEADVVVPPEPHSFSPAELQRDRRQRQHP